MVEQNPNYTQYLREDAITTLKKLQEDEKPTFGIMTPQHMVEHLIKTIKFSIKTYGEAPEQPTEKQLGFKKFIFSDIPFKSGDPNKAKLEDLKFESLDQAKEDFAKAIDRFYNYFAENPDAQPYNDFFGALNKEELERFHYKHLQHHFKQFSLID